MLASHTLGSSQTLIEQGECLKVFEGEATVDSDKLLLVLPFLELRAAQAEREAQRRKRQQQSRAMETGPCDSQSLDEEMRKANSSHEEDATKSFKVKRELDQRQQQVLQRMLHDRDTIFPPKLMLRTADGTLQQTSLFSDLCERMELKIHQDHSSDAPDSGLALGRHRQVARSDYGVVGSPQPSFALTSNAYANDGDGSQQPRRTSWRQGSFASRLRKPTMSRNLHAKHVPTDGAPDATNQT